MEDSRRPAAGQSEDGPRIRLCSRLPSATSACSRDGQSLDRPIPRCTFLPGDAHDNAPDDTVDVTDAATVDAADDGTDGVDVVTDVASISNTVRMTAAVFAHGTAYEAQGDAADNTMDATNIATVTTTGGDANGASISHEGTNLQA